MGCDKLRTTCENRFTNDAGEEFCRGSHFLCEGREKSGFRKKSKKSGFIKKQKPFIEDMPWHQPMPKTLVEKLKFIEDNSGFVDSQKHVDAIYNMNRVYAKQKKLSGPQMDYVDVLVTMIRKN